MSQESIAHTIRNILAQCNNTSISIGHTEGHYISTRQVAVLEECADLLEELKSVAGIDTPATSVVTEHQSEESSFRARRLELAEELKKKQIALVVATPVRRPQINQEIGQLLSERAKLDKLIRQVESLNLA